MEYQETEYKARRLTPRECARLQGFPPDWCDDVPHTDSAEYKLWGNGIALPCLLPMLKAMKERGCDTLGNFFSGSGAWELAAKIVGMTPIYEAEVEPFPVKLEKARFPECIQLGDVTKINGTDIPLVDVMTNSSPCQNLSMAGNRKGLEGGESRLFSDSIRITRERRQLPKYWCWENVPGALSSNGGEDFRTVLEEVARLKKEDAVIPKPKKWGGCGVVDGDDWQIAWRVMDAQYYGVPQRRRRIFLVASFGDRSAAEVLFERESVSWNFKEIAKTWEDTSASFGERIDRASRIVNRRIREDERDMEGRSNELGMSNPLLFSNHPSDSRIKGPETVAETLSARMGTGGGEYSAGVWMTNKTRHMCRWTKTEKIYTLMASDYKDPPAVLTETAKPSPEGNKRTIFVMDRASFNAGEKAQFPPQIHEGGVSTVPYSKRNVCGLL